MNKTEHQDSVLTAEAIRFIEALHYKFQPQRKELLRLRQKRQSEFDAGQKPDFLPQTEAIRQDARWESGDSSKGSSQPQSGNNGTRRAQNDDQRF